jgi:hypothetical protein
MESVMDFTVTWTDENREEHPALLHVVQTDEGFVFDVIVEDRVVASCWWMAQEIVDLYCI